MLVPSSESPRHEAPVAQVRPFMQHPPPREAGQENQPVEHVYCDVEVVEGEDVEVVEGDVGTAAVEDDWRRVDEEADVEGWT